MIKPIIFLQAITFVFLLGLFLVSTDPVSAAGRVFYDGSEAGNTNLWSQDDTRNRCTSVTTATDGVTGPYAGSRMIRCNSDGSVAWNDPAAYETLLFSPTYCNEMLIRFQLRPDQNHAGTGGSAKKIARWSGTGHDMFQVMLDAGNDAGMKSEGTAWGQELDNYWGGTPGDTAGGYGQWDRVAYYINHSTGNVKV